MSVGKLIFGDAELADLDSAENLAAILMRIREKFIVENPMIGMVHTNGNVLTLGISAKGCYVNYIDSSGDPPYYSSLGERTFLSDNEVVAFRVSPAGHVSEISGRNIISFEKMLTVAKAFLHTGKRPETEITWEVD